MNLHLIFIAVGLDVSGLYMGCHIDGSDRDINDALAIFISNGIDHCTLSRVLLQFRIHNSSNPGRGFF